LDDGWQDYKINLQLEIGAGLGLLGA